MTSHLPHTIPLTLLLLLGACVSSPDAQQPQSLRDAQNLLSQGVEQYQASQYLAAQQLFEQALAQYRLLDNPEGIVASTINIARVLHTGGKHARAQQWLQQARKLNELYQPNNQRQLSEHIELLQAAVEIENHRLNDAAARLEQLIETMGDADIRLGALQLRTRIAQLQNNAFNNWLQRYAGAVNTAGDSAHLARLVRFQAHAAPGVDEQDRLFALALERYRQQANRPGIAATLTEWAQQEIIGRQYLTAENKLLRALRIRLAMRDALHAQQALILLQDIYRQQSRKDEFQKTRDWLQRLSVNGFNQWQAAVQAFDTYPQ